MYRLQILGWANSHAFPPTRVFPVTPWGQVPTLSLSQTLVCWLTLLLTLFVSTWELSVTTEEGGGFLHSWQNHLNPSSASLPTSKSKSSSGTLVHWIWHSALHLSHTRALSASVIGFLHCLQECSLCCEWSMQVGHTPSALRSFLFLQDGVAQTAMMIDEADVSTWM